MTEIGNNTERRSTERTEKAETRIQKLEGAERTPLPPAFEESKNHIKIYQGDCLEILARIPEGTVEI